ncbi:MAG: inositol monophosphatase family protein, partial [Mariprofundaceae bacterium]|nr:inositol monophosphatase family protein [Mariprofundaceae bacterium]
MADKQAGETIDIHLITELLCKAGSEILLPAFQRQSNTTRTKDDGSLVTETDMKCQQFIREQLAASYPGIGFLGEEMSEKEQQTCLQQENHFWCLDPLDGTSNFVASFPVFGTSLALMEDGLPVLACIHDPVRGETFSAFRHKGAWLNNQPLHVRSEQPLSEAIGLIDFKRLDHKLAIRLATEKYCRSQRNIGSCALEWAWLAAGRSQFIIHGSEKLWDYAAGWLLAGEAGCTASDFNQQHPFPANCLSSSIVAATSDTLHRQLS